MTGACNHLAVLPVDGHAIGGACDAARDFTDAAGLDGDLGARLCIIIEELVANLVDHAGLTSADRIALRLDWDGRGVTVELTDPGPPFDPRVAPPPGELPPEHGGGAGLAMVQAWAHVESYMRLGEINQLTLRLVAGPGPA